MPQYRGHQRAQEAEKQLQYGKAPGEDGIMPELLKVVDLDNIFLRISKGFYFWNFKPYFSIKIRRPEQDREL